MCSPCAMCGQLLEYSTKSETHTGCLDRYFYFLLGCILPSPSVSSTSREDTELESRPLFFVLASTLAKGPEN